ncbi:MAG: phytanoyl-CoA dioxygenase family protein [Pseudomonadota bacterium]
MPTLTDEQKVRFWREGYLVLEDALRPDQLSGLKRDFAAWIEESRTQTNAYGETIDGRPRFDVQPGHSADSPGLRRVSSPTEISETYLSVMRDNRALDAVAELIGPNIKHNNTKVNSKLPGTKTEVKYHQDFMFEPHTNHDVIAVLFFVDEVTMENGPLEVVPGSHDGPLHTLWHEGEFTGAVAPEIESEVRESAVSCTGPAGSACLMHTRLLHGSTPNNSTQPRTLYIVTYNAEDAMPLCTNHIPSRYEGELVRGEATGMIRCMPYEMEMPEYPKEASFFGQQARDSEAA